MAHTDISHAIRELLFGAVHLTCELERYDYDVSTYIDHIPAFLLQRYDPEDNDDLLSQFMEWLETSDL